MHGRTSGAISGVVISAICAAFLLVAPAPAHAEPGAVVVSQVYGGGGNSGAVLTNDFVAPFGSG